MVVLDEEHLEPLEGWAILVHGKICDDLIFGSDDAAETRRRLNPTLSRCDVCLCEW